MYLKLATLFVITFSLAACVPSALPAPTATAPILSPTVTAEPTSSAPAGFGTYSIFGFVQRDITYCKGGANALGLDIYLPKEFNNKPTPALLYFHGNPGSKGAVYPLIEFMRSGFIVVDVEFRQPPDFKVPQSIADVKCAVRFLRAVAKQYAIDPNRIGVYGCSYGGSLSAILAVTDARAGLEGDGGYAEQSSRAQAAVMISGVSNWQTMVVPDAQANSQNLQDFFGVNSFDDPIVSKTSPINYVSKDAAPMLIIQGESDATVPIQQAQELYTKMKDAGVPVTLKIIANGSHCPTSADITQAMLDFFKQTLT